MLSALDSRYYNQIEPIDRVFSDENYYEIAFNIELQYFFALCKHNIGHLKNLDKDFDRIKTSKHLFNYSRFLEIEKETKHDIKSVEILTREYLSESFKIPEEFLGFVHFGLTSQDIVSLAKTAQLISANMMISTKITNFTTSFIGIKNSNEYFVARTHGQKAVFTTMKEQFNGYDERIYKEETLLNRDITAKFGGAINNSFSVNMVIEDTFPYLYRIFAQDFIKTHYRCEMTTSKVPSQTDNYRFLISQMQVVVNISNILIDFSQDMWQYISRGLLKLPIDKKQVGSSTMPQKVNPIQFENAEGNCKMAKGIAQIFIDELNISRLQRDLSDITMVRNVGLAYGHLYLAIDNLTKGISNIEIDKEVCVEERYDSYQCFAEYIQLFLKFNGHQDSYNLLKDMTRNNKGMTQLDLEVLINGLEGVEDELKEQMIEKISTIFSS